LSRRGCFNVLFIGYFPVTACAVVGLLSWLSESQIPGSVICVAPVTLVVLFALYTHLTGWWNRTPPPFSPTPITPAMIREARRRDEELRKRRGSHRGGIFTEDPPPWVVNEWFGGKPGEWGCVVILALALTSLAVAYRGTDAAAVVLRAYPRRGATTSVIPFNIVERSISSHTTAR
jgi:hypothetical protein